MRAQIVLCLSKDSVVIGVGGSSDRLALRKTLEVRQ